MNCMNCMNKIFTRSKLTIISAVLALSGLLCPLQAATATKQPSANTIDQSFIEEISQAYQLNPDWIRQQTSSATYNADVIRRITTPWESKPWYKYRQIFLKPERVEQAIQFWKQHEQTLKQAEQAYGVPAQFILAILGVETYFGRFKGKDNVLDALYTLGFHYPKRAKFFRSELGHFLALSHEQGWDPKSIQGSYAGAMGFPQFISSSYRAYAIDFDRDGKRDLLNSPADAIGSIANYFVSHGWIANGCMTEEVELTESALPMVQTDTKVKHSWKQLNATGISSKASPNQNEKVLLFPLEESESQNSYWLGCNNFYVITRYNHSRLYAMAVYQLSEQIKAAWTNS